MRVLVVSGIWPPDIGGPATHAPELARWLLDHGHSVEVVVTADRAPAQEPYEVHWVRRSLPAGPRQLAASMMIAARARSSDVVYATSMLGRTAMAAIPARRPYVLKVTSDPAFERARRRGLVSGATSDFQGGGGGATAAGLRLVRDVAVRHAAHVVCPSSFMALLVEGWGVARSRVTVLPNPAPSAAEAIEADVGDRPALVFAGRLTAAKNLDLALRAVSAVPDVQLIVVGDGEERIRLEALAESLGLGERVRFLGARPRPEVLGLLRDADAAVLSSAWENFPHGAVEALAMGTPVIATDVGGVAEVVRHDQNGLLVASGDEQGLAAAIERLLANDELRTRLAGAAAPSVGRFALDEIYGTLEQVLLDAAR